MPNAVIVDALLGRTVEAAAPEDAVVRAQLGGQVVPQLKHVAEPGQVVGLVVRADVLVGEEGIPRAIRFVRFDVK